MTASCNGRRYAPPLKTHSPIHVAAGRTIAPKALAIERQAAFYIDEMFYADGIGLQDAATAWDEAGRTDRAEFLRNLMAEVKRSG